MSPLRPKFALTAFCLLSGQAALATSLVNLQDLLVDIGYGVYRGAYNSTTHLNIWKGIRYAVPPDGDLCWQAPAAPIISRNDMVDAIEFAPGCPQAAPAPFPIIPAPSGSEDCLSLNVYAPRRKEKTKLPVLVWVHSGGYGFGNGQQDMSEITIENDSSFIAVSIQYRLGAFGFLSSTEIEQNGALNAGILDMAFALQWVQDHIDQFGSDKLRVTIVIITASPYLPPQHNFNAAAPTRQTRQWRAHVGNNANEGPLFVPTIGSTDALQAWLQNAFPSVTSTGLEAILAAYPLSNLTNSDTFATTGLSPVTALDTSSFASGIQQRAYNIYAEATFVCPSYWLSDVFATNNRTAFHYQYSVPGALHGSDVTAYFGPATPSQPHSFTTVFRQVWGHFVTAANPGTTKGLTNLTWPAWTEDGHSKMLNLNITVGMPYSASQSTGTTITEYTDPGLQDYFTVVHALEWEGNRG
ncbi:unnamed protein product [Alternaria alternata]